ncbi:MAG: SipW-dependent-type signal peptide-containing protein [Firmicutes bacterium]|nr:SipW-dependent-type signal peptide-containing protein [Bacillota bacterium]
MKKKLLSLSLVAVLVIVSITGATLAYLTDNDNEDNTFVVGNVKIDLVEQQRGENGLVAFEDGKVLLPLVGSAQGQKDNLGLPTAANYVDKIVTVKNTGASNAYVRVLVAVPADLDYPAGPLHWNLGNKFNGATDATYGEEVAWKCVAERTTVKVNDGEAVKDVVCNIYAFTYKTPVTANAVTPYAAITGFYLDSAVDNYVDEAGKLVYTYNGKAVNYDLTQGVTVPVYAQAVQAAGFDTADAAFTAANLSYNPW